MDVVVKKCLPVASIKQNYEVYCGTVRALEAVDSVCSTNLKFKD